MIAGGIVGAGLLGAGVLALKNKAERDNRVSSVNEVSSVNVNEVSSVNRPKMLRKIRRPKQTIVDAQILKHDNALSKRFKNEKGKKQFWEYRKDRGDPFPESPRWRSAEHRKLRKRTKRYSLRFA